MIQIPVHDIAGKEVGTVELDEQQFGGEVRPALLKQAYVRTHSNKRLGTSQTRTRSMVQGSTRKLYRQKGTGNARRGDKKANILRGGGHAKAKKYIPGRFRKDMPAKMRKLANRNALLAKAQDSEIKLIASFDFDKPSTRQFRQLLNNLNIDRSCLVAMDDTRQPGAVSARNLDSVDVTQIDRLCAFDLLSHRYLLVDQKAFEAYVQRVTDKLAAAKQEKE